MNVTCPQCQASYFVDEQKIPHRGGRLTCPSCGTRWTIYRPGTGEMPAVGPAAAAASSAPEPASVPVTSARSAVAAESPVTCPKCGHSFSPSAQVQPAAPSKSRRVVLLVEDQKYFTELASEALGSDYRTISVASKDEALKVIAAERPSLMVLDLSLARGQDGRDLLRAIPSKAFPILIYTARDETELYGEAWEELKRLGADDIVHKGMNIGEELRRKAAVLIKGR